MALRIEIAKRYDEKLELRIGDLDGSIEMTNFTEEEVLDQIQEEIKQMNCEVKPKPKGSQ